MKYLTFIPLIWILFINSLRADVINTQDLEGQWRGDISMVDHHHPLTFTLKKNDNKGFSVNYSFWDMTFVDYDDNSAPNNYFVVRDNAFELVLSGSGIRIDGTLNNQSHGGNLQLHGNVQWMGRTQPIVLNRISDESSAGFDIASHEEMSSKKMNVAILVFDGVDALDWSGPLEVFDYAHTFNTYTVAAEMKPMQGGAYQVLPKYTFENMPKADIVIIPGGSIGDLFLHEPTKNWLQQVSKSAQHVMSICNASTFLAANNLLTGVSATTHGAWHPWLTAQSKEMGFSVVDKGRFVDNGKIITTAGVSSGIDGALHLVAKLKGLKHAKMTARMMEYRWQPETDYPVE